MLFLCLEIFGAHSLKFQLTILAFCSFWSSSCPWPSLPFPILPLPLLPTCRFQAYSLHNANPSGCFSPPSPPVKIVLLRYHFLWEGFLGFLTTNLSLTSAFHVVLCTFTLAHILSFLGVRLVVYRLEGMSVPQRQESHPCSVFLHLRGALFR